MAVSQLIIPSLASGQSDGRTSGFLHGATQVRLQVMKTRWKTHDETLVECSASSSKTQGGFLVDYAIAGTFFSLFL